MGRISCGSCGSNGLQKADIDVGGRRFSKITPTGVTTYYFYDGYDLILEYDSNWNMQYQCTYGPGIDNQISIYQAGQSYYYIKDMLGSIVAIADQSGTIIQTYKYDAWGTIITQTGSLNNPFTYTGREYDAESGLYYYRARYYDSVIGRFLQRDPLGLVDGPNVYVYVKNDPVNKIDPLGLNLLDDIKKWGNDRWNELTGGAAQVWNSIKLGGITSLILVIIIYNNYKNLINIRIPILYPDAYFIDDHILSDCTYFLGYLIDWTYWRYYWEDEINKPDECFRIKHRGGILGFEGLGYTPMSGPEIIDKNTCKSLYENQDVHRCPNKEGGGSYLD